MKRIIAENKSIREKAQTQSHSLKQKGLKPILQHLQESNCTLGRLSKRSKEIHQMQQKESDRRDETFKNAIKEQRLQPLNK